MEPHFNKMTWLAQMLMLAMFGAFLCWIFNSVSDAQAEVRPSVAVQFYYIRGPRSMPYHETLRAIKRAQGYYNRNLKIKLDVKRVKVQRDIFKGKNYLDQTFARFLDWYDWTEGKRHRGEITQVILSPQFEGKGKQGQWYTTGLAWLACYRDSDLFNFSAAYITLKNKDRHERFLHGVTAIAHEIGHNLGADHRNDCSLMDTLALYCMGESTLIPLPHPHSKKVMQACAWDKPLEDLNK